MKKKSKIIIARIMAVLMIISVLPLDTWGSVNVVKAAAAYVHNFTGEDGEYNAVSSFFTFNGSEATSTKEVSYTDINGDQLTLTKAFDMSNSNTDVKISFTSETSGKLVMVTDSGYASKAVKIDGSSTSFSNGVLEKDIAKGEHKIIKGNPSVTIYYIAFIPDDGGSGEDPTTVAKPTADPTSGAITAGTVVKLSAQSGASIKYTLNGDETNTDNWATYETAGITINESDLPATLKAIAIKGDVSSDVATFEYTLDTSVPKPTADPSGGEIEAGSTVELKMADDVESIRYTLDSDVQLTDKNSGTPYDGPFSITTLPATLRAIAVRGEDISEVATFNYTLKLADAPTVDVTSGTAVEKGKEVNITATGADAIRYTVDGSDPTAESNSVTQVDADTATVIINKALTIKAVSIKDGVASKPLEASYTIIKVETPTADKTGSVEKDTEIKLSSATEGAVIYYTKDGTVPDTADEDTLHAASPVKITITAGMTIKAIAVKDNCDNSDVATFNYKILDGTGLVKHVLDPDAIMEASTETKYEYDANADIEGTDGYYKVVATSSKKAQLNKITDLRRNKGTTEAPDYEYYYPNLSWADVDLTERKYAVAITGGAMSATENAIKFTTEAYATGVVYFSLKEVPTKARDFLIQRGTNTSISGAVASKDAGTNAKVGKLEFELSTPGTYYVGFSSSGGIIPYMEVIEDYTKEAEEGPEETNTKTITVDDATETIIGAELLGDVDFSNASDESNESVDVVNILLKAATIADSEISSAIKNKVADQMEFLELESDKKSKAYYYNLSLEDKDKKSDNALALKQGGVSFQVSYDKLGMEHKDTLVVFNGTEIVNEDKITRDNKSKSFWVEADSEGLSRPYIFVVSNAKTEPGKLTIINSYGYEEGACAEWNDYTDTEYDGYVAYVSTTPVFPDNDKTQRIDNELIRKYDGYWRVDTVGLKSGTYYIKVDAVKIDAATKEPTEVVASNATGPLKVTNYDRSGFAFSQDSTYKTGSGAYKDDGTLRDGAQVLYVTAATAKTVTLDVKTNNKGGTETCTGLQTILDARQKGYDTTPLDIRIIGCVTLNDLDKISSSSEGLQIKGKGSYSEMNITIEGIGEDAVVKDFGFLIRGCGNVELRNFAIMAFMDDGVSIDTENCNLWIHDLDIFYGTAGGASDQAKGDGTIDLKGDSTNLTIAYNHFWDSGKSSLCGMKSETKYEVTYHHNWFDHSDSRHPRIRTGTVHIYNNYYDGNSKYGVGMTMGGSAFVEANYFRNCKYPMMISKQGTDASGDGTFSGENGGVIKAYNNKIEQAKRLVYANSNAGGATEPSSATQFDAYLASSRNEAVPDTYKAVAGGTIYNNFDTSGKFDLGVDPSNIDDPSNVKAIVTAKAGRLNGGDFARAGYDAFFATDADENYSVDTTLKAAVVNYKTSVKAIGGIDGVDTPVSGSSSATAVTPSSGVIAPVASVPSGFYSETQTITLTSDTSGAVIYYTIDGSNPADSGNTERKKYENTSISVENSMVIKAVAVVEENGKAVDSSYVAKYSYIISKDGGTRYTVTIYKIEGEEASDTLIFKAGEFITEDDLPNPTRTGYTFLGWKDGSGNDVTLPKTVNENMVLIAKWEKGKETYTITIDLGYTGAPDPTTKTVNEGESLDSLDTPTRTGFIFNGWVDEEDKAVTIPFTPTKSMTIKATWTEKDDGDDAHWVVYIDKNDGSIPERVEVEKGKTVPDNKLAAPVRTGYTFNGWVDESNNKISLPYKPEKSIIIKATWTKNTTTPSTNEYWSVKLEKTEYTYTGTAIKPGVTVYDNNGKALVEGVDYTVKYSNNLKASVVKNNGSYENIDKSGKKLPTVTVSGKGILSGKYAENFVIKPKDISDEDDKEVQAAEIRIVKGSKASTPVICYNAMKLGAKDYKYDKTKTFPTNGTLEIEGQGNYEGTRSITVKVYDSKTELKTAVKKFKVTVKNTPVLVYSGENLRADIISRIELTPALPEGSYAVTLPDEVKDAGTVKFMVVGLGDYSGCSVSKSIKIQPKTLDEKAVEITGVPNEGVDYSNTGAVVSDLSIKVKDKTEPLVNGTDYKLSYSNNKKVGTASFTITFKGNYKGKIAKVKDTEFKINKAPLDGTNTVVELPDKVCKENANCKSTAYVTVNGVLVKASEYEVEYYVGDSTTPTNKPKVTTFNGNKVTVNVKVKVKAGSKNYKTGTGNEITGSYTVWKKGSSNDNDLSKAKVTFHNQADCKDKKVTKFEYNGGAVKPDGINVNIGKSTTNLYSSGEDSKVTVTYVNNVNKGKATVIIKPAADSDLIGSKVVTFSIVPKNASGLNKSALDALSDTFNISDTIKNIFK
ncbi:MAG: hypothetical protein HDR03_14845 [Lachnospiraceae bacterium]|nr:hypothetical protein [Lachnospiraceae bacterium]